MKEPVYIRLAMAELNWGRTPSAVLWIGSRAVHQYWALLAPYFRDVLLVPQRRSEDEIIAWSWHENGESRQPTALELAALRKRLAGDLQAFSDNAHDGAMAERGTGGARNQPGIAQIAAAMEGWVSRLLAMTDGEFAAYVACTEAGLRLHSWGLTTAAVPFYPDERKSAKEGAADSADEPSAGAEPSATPVTRGRRRIGWVFLAVFLLAGGLWIGREAWRAAANHEQQSSAEANGARRESGGFNLRKLWAKLGGSVSRSRETEPAQSAERGMVAVSIGNNSSGAGGEALTARTKTSRGAGATEAGQGSVVSSAGETAESQRGDQRLFVGSAGATSASDSTAGGAAAPTPHGVATGGVSAAPSGGGASAAVSTAMPANQSETSPGGASRLPLPQSSISGAPPAPMGVDDRVSAAAADTLAPHQKSAAAPERAMEETKVDAKTAPATAKATTDDGVGTVLSRTPERADELSEAGQVREKERTTVAGKTSLSARPETEEKGAVAPAGAMWARVVRVQAAEWQVRLLGETILPTQPMRVGVENTFETVRAQMLAERRAQLPAAFATVRGRRGFAVESTAGPLHWRVSTGAETVSTQADGNRAEIFWAEGDAPSSGTYEAVNEQGREVARLEVSADRVPVLALATEVRGWCWLTIDGEVTSFIGRRLAEETMPPGWLWTADARGARLEIRLTTAAGTTEVEPVALLDPATGWAVVCPITLAAMSSPQ